MNRDASRYDNGGKEAQFGHMLQLLVAALIVLENTLPAIPWASAAIPSSWVKGQLQGIQS